MRFALNYSPEAAALIDKLDIDLFKCPDWTDMVTDAQALRPVYVHFPLKAGHGPVPDSVLRDIESWLKQTDTIFVNTHLVLREGDMQDPDNTDEAVERMVAHIQPLVARFGADRVIAENIPYPEKHAPTLRVCAEPEVISRTIETIGVGLLLDIGHARLTAGVFGIDPKQYIQQLPVIDRIREIHITGLGDDPDGVRTDHMPMTDADWELFGWVLDHMHRGEWAAPQVVACEYGGTGELFGWRSESAVIAEQIPRMIAMVRGITSLQVE